MISTLSRSDWVIVTLFAVESSIAPSVNVELAISKLSAVLSVIVESSIVELVNVTLFPVPSLNSELVIILLLTVELKMLNLKICIV